MFSPSGEDNRCCRLYTTDQVIIGIWHSLEIRECSKMAVTTMVSKKTLLPTPALPQDLPGVELTDNARQVLLRRYVRHGDNGQPIESVEEMFWRVAYHIAKVEESYGNDVTARAREFYILLTSRKFFPNSPTFTGAGTPLG